eukprot:TRINITY_DN9889_c0_g1_i1.p1 TRINITY_DN9889_c0_g1~~TRINITY_DN9889_c0_g1_i1.p1  ORF type:complete len:105 (+),score=9.16 TRINITY_DN9889_c0_g1_i1:170-484(+)
MLVSSHCEMKGGECPCAATVPAKKLASEDSSTVGEVEPSMPSVSTPKGKAFTISSSLVCPCAPAKQRRPPQDLSLKRRRMTPAAAGRLFRVLNFDAVDPVAAQA